MVSNNKEKKFKQIEELKRKAEITRNAYFMISRKYKLMNGWLHFLTLMFASIVAVLTFADFNDFLPIFPDLNQEYYNLLVSGLALFVFILTVAEEFLRLANKAAINESPAKQLTTFIRTASSVQEYDDITDEDIDRLILQYTMICDSAPEVPDRDFYKAKQKLLKKIEISRALDKNPFLSIYMFTFTNWFKKNFKKSKISSRDKNFDNQKTQFIEVDRNSKGDKV